MAYRSERTVQGAGMRCGPPRHTSTRPPTDDIAFLDAWQRLQIAYRWRSGAVSSYVRCSKTRRLAQKASDCAALRFCRASSRGDEPTPSVQWPHRHPRFVTLRRSDVPRASTCPMASSPHANTRDLSN